MAIRSQTRVNLKTRCRSPLPTTNQKPMLYTVSLHLYVVDVARCKVFVPCPGYCIMSALYLFTTYSNCIGSGHFRCIFVNHRPCFVCGFISVWGSQYPSLFGSIHWMCSAHSQLLGGFQISSSWLPDRYSLASARISAKSKS